MKKLNEYYLLTWHLRLSLEDIIKMNDNEREFIVKQLKNK